MTSLIVLGELMINDVMSVEYTELDNGCPALCFCSDLIIPLTNKTMVQSYINYTDNDMKFKILNLTIQDLSFTYTSPEVTQIKAKVNGKFEFMGYVDNDDLYTAMEKVLTRLKEGEDEN